RLLLGRGLESGRIEAAARTAAGGRSAGYTGGAHGTIRVTRSIPYPGLIWETIHKRAPSLLLRAFYHTGSNVVQAACYPPDYRRQPRPDAPTRSTEVLAAPSRTAEPPSGSISRSQCRTRTGSAPWALLAVSARSARASRRRRRASRRPSWGPGTCRP